jgi:hypothetical protein
MAIERIYGRCSGNDVIFAQDEETGRWHATVPARPEIWAQDFAGNVAYFATVQVTFDPSTMCMKVSIIDVGDKWTVEDVKEVLSGDGTSVRWQLIEIQSIINPDDLMSKVTKCEVCGE